MTETKDNLPAPVPGTARDLLRVEKIKLRFAEILKDRAPQFVASVASLIYLSPVLNECEPNSVIAAAIVAASLDLPIDRNLGFATIVPYNSKRGKTAQFQMQWKGYIQLAHRTKQYRTLNVNEVFEGEIVNINRFNGAVTFGEKRGETVVGYLAYMLLINGFEKYEYMSVEEIEAHGKHYSKSYSDERSKWKTDFDSMARKTVLKRLLTRWGILTVDMQRAVSSESIVDEPEPETKAMPVSRAKVNSELFGEDEPSGQSPVTDPAHTTVPEPEDETGELPQTAKPGQKTATVANDAGAKWNTFCDSLAKRYPYYAKAGGEPDRFHIGALAVTFGVGTVTLDNLPALTGKIEGYAKEKHSPVSA